MGLGTGISWDLGDTDAGLWRLVSFFSNCFVCFRVRTFPEIAQTKQNKDQIDPPADPLTVSSILIRSVVNPSGGRYNVSMDALIEERL